MTKKINKDQIYTELLPDMLLVAKRYLKIAKGEVNGNSTSGQMDACKDVWRTLTEVADRDELEDLVEQMKTHLPVRK